MLAITTIYGNGGLNGHDLRLPKSQVGCAIGISATFHGKRAVNSTMAHTPGGVLLRLLASTSLQSQILTVVRFEAYPHSENGPETSRLCALALDANRTDGRLRTLSGSVRGNRGH